MTRAEFLGLQAVGWKAMLTHWWDFLLLGLLVFSVVLASAYAVTALIIAIRKRVAAKKKRNTSLPTAITRCIRRLVSSNEPFRVCHEPREPPKSFGVFLGACSNPPTENQSKLFSQWDLIIVDPLQKHVVETVRSGYCTARHVIARLDVGLIYTPATSTASDPAPDSNVNAVVLCLTRLTDTLMACFKPSNPTACPPYNGLLLANWRASFSPMVCTEYVRFLKGIGLDIYLEASEPYFIPETDVRRLDVTLFQGVVCRNASILSTGDRRNCYQMHAMQPVLRAVAAQACLRSMTLMMWEPIDNQVNLDLAVARRSFVWYKYYSAICWIGPQAALMDADVARARTLADEPLGALMWLKNDAVMDAQQFWRCNDTIANLPTGHETLFDNMSSFIPNLRSKLALYPCQPVPSRQIALMDDFDWTVYPPASPLNNPFTCSSLGQAYTGLGCFPIGLECTTKDFTNLADQQRHLRSLGLLDPVSVDELRACAVKYATLHQYYLSTASTVDSPAEHTAVHDLLHLIAHMQGKDTDQLRVYYGIEAGFKTTLSVKFHAVYDIDPDTNTMEVYIALKAPDLASTLLHTFMSSRGITRPHCLMAEVTLAEQLGTLRAPWSIPPRFHQDFGMLTPSESLRFMQRLTVQSRGEYPVLCARVRSSLEYQLLEVPTLLQLRQLHGERHLRRQISAKEMVDARIAWYREHGCYHPDPQICVDLFTAVDQRVYEMLILRQADVLAALEANLLEMLQPGRVDASVDMFALAVFCAFRRLGLEETYLEILDRNPLPNPHPDQAACFAEMFAMGSRCEWYLGVSPNVLGEILTIKHQAYYRIPANQPPPRNDLATETPSAYASSQIDIDPSYKPPALPAHARISFLGIFAMPALIDIVCLTIIGRGLYLTTYMTQTEKSMATNALMLALFLTGAIGTWISSGGSYYLHSMAFPAMNHYILSRFTAGIAICLLGGGSAFLVVGVVKGFYAGLVFFLYFLFLTVYLSLLATLAIYQLPDFMFQSGRLVIMQCIPILFISPIVTLWSGNDIIIYPTVMAVFLLCLILGARRITSQWSTWYHNIPTITDQEVAQWYMASTGISPDELQALGASPVARKAIAVAVQAEIGRKWYRKASDDALILRLARGQPATLVLMDWYCKYSRTNMPYMYSPTWNLQTKAAVDTLRDMQKGLKLHNAFIHWRHAGSEVWLGVLYFVIALLDKWVAIFSGGSIVGLSAANSAIYRLAVGFGLAYYLCGAVALDSVAQPLWAAANKKDPVPIANLSAYASVAIAGANKRRRLYWTSLAKFLMLDVWGLALSAGIMWAFNVDTGACVMYLAYVGAYTGLLWYQYNRIFTGAKALKDLLVACVIGFPTGLLLHHFLPEFPYSSVIALAAGTWTAGILSYFTSDTGKSRLRLPAINRVKSKLSIVAGSKNTDENGDNEKIALLPTGPAKYYAHGALGPSAGLSQAALAEIFNSVMALPPELRYRLNPTEHPGTDVMTNLMSQYKTRYAKPVREAFRDADHLISQTSDLWACGTLSIDLVPTRHMIRSEQKMRAVSRLSNDALCIFVFVGLDLVGEEWVMDIKRNCKAIAEAAIHATAEVMMNYPPNHATLTELLTSSEHGKDASRSRSSMIGNLIPEGMRWQLEHSQNERMRIVETGDQTLLQWLILGVNADLEWDRLPRDMRMYLLDRCCGRACCITNSEMDWLDARFKHELGRFDLTEYLARCNLGVALTHQVNSYVRLMEADIYNLPEPPDSAYENCLDFPLSESANTKKRSLLAILRGPFEYVFHALAVCAKFFVISLVADPEYQRELDYVLSRKPAIVRFPVKALVLGLWNFCKMLQRFIYPLFIFHNHAKVSQLFAEMKGIKTQIKKKRVTIESLRGPTTCFINMQADGFVIVHHFSGRHKEAPKNTDRLQSINMYSPKMVLLRREEYAGYQRVNVFVYEYADKDKKRSGLRARLPLLRTCIEGSLHRQIIRYDDRGYIIAGSAIKDDNVIEFRFWYRSNAKFDDEPIRAEYVLAHITVNVAWCVPPTRGADKLDRWIPHSKVTEALFTQGNEMYHSKWTYDHKFHPVISTTLNGQPSATPAMIEHDWFDVLKKPRNSSFINDNPLFLFSSAQPGILRRLIGKDVQWYPISTSRARTHLWKSWKDGKDFDAVTARWLDERSLRKDSVMKPYWKARDWGRLQSAAAYIRGNSDSIMARTDLDAEISSWSALAYKVSDFCTFGQGGDSRINTRSMTSQIKDSNSNLHVLAMDTGTWPYESGGVSACRRDMVNNLETVKWHVLAEMANDFGYPRFQIEKNVQSLTILPLWGLDFLTPSHGIFQNCLDSEIERKLHGTSEEDIGRNFLPILAVLVRCARAIRLEEIHLEAASKALVDLNRYFQSSRHWSDVWTSDIVKAAWREFWLSEEYPFVENVRPPSEWMESERPTLVHLDNALDMWHRYLFIFSIPVPEKIPDVFQASHHFAGASYGVLCKLLRQCTLHVWDHCISWREVTVFLSSAMSFDSPFVCTSLIQLSRLASVLVLKHADVVLPCADFFNPGWEIEIGTQQGRLMHRRRFARKIDPVVNGITNMERFSPIESIKTKIPTVTMLSHIRFVKDIKNAILAADIIVNDWGFTDYQLDIYGDMEKAPTYSVECQEIIASKGLRDHVALKGLGNPMRVLEDTWVFMNSSVSEGLPLAMGEAALTGVPLICTDVGASFRVVVDKQGKRISKLIAPNDSMSLARAQLQVLGLLDEWAMYADEDGSESITKLPLRPTPAETKLITARMYAQQEQRRRLGMLSRDNILTSFSGDRYLREHEQMLWIGKHQATSYRQALDMGELAVENMGSVSEADGKDETAKTKKHKRKKKKKVKAEEVV